MYQFKVLRHRENPDIYHRTTFADGAYSHAVDLTSVAPKQIGAVDLFPATETDESIRANLREHVEEFDDGAWEIVVMTFKVE